MKKSTYIKLATSSDLIGSHTPVRPKPKPALEKFFERCTQFVKLWKERFKGRLRRMRSFFNAAEARFITNARRLLGHLPPRFSIMKPALVPGQALDFARAITR